MASGYSSDDSDGAPAEVGRSEIQQQYIDQKKNVDKTKESKVTRGVGETYGRGLQPVNESEVSQRLLDKLKKREDERQVALFNYRYECSIF